MITVMRGSACLGLVLARGKLGFEGFSTEEKSLGLFNDQSAAMTAVINAAGDAS